MALAREKVCWPSGQADSNQMANSNENQLLFYNVENICNYHSVPSI